MDIRLGLGEDLGEQVRQEGNDQRAELGERAMVGMGGRQAASL